MAKSFENTFSVREIYKDTYCIVDNAMGDVNIFLLVMKGSTVMFIRGE